jgi:hypothetical protein
MFWVSEQVNKRVFVKQRFWLWFEYMKTDYIATTGNAGPQKEMQMLKWDLF